MDVPLHLMDAARPADGKRGPLDQLEKFCAEFLRKMPVIGAVPFAGAVSIIENVTSILLYRKGQFQVQMFAVPEGTVIPEHSHPNIDTIVIYVGGNILFSHSGKYVYPKEAVIAMPGPLGLASKRAHAMRVRPNDIHGAVAREGGAVFLGVQQWLNGIAPHCAGSDYSGVAMGERHLDQVVSGNATTKPALTEKDAASLEP